MIFLLTIDAITDSIAIITINIIAIITINIIAIITINRIAIITIHRICIITISTTPARGRPEGSASRSWVGPWSPASRRGQDKRFFL